MAKAFGTAGAISIIPKFTGLVYDVALGAAARTRVLGRGCGLINPLHIPGKRIASSRCEVSEEDAGRTRGAPTAATHGSRRSHGAPFERLAHTSPGRYVTATGTGIG